MNPPSPSRPASSPASAPFSTNPDDAPRRRRAGVLLPLFSIRGPQGWGTGEIPDLARFAAWAHGADLSVLQLLPVNELSGGETSPYGAATAFALDPVYLALDELSDFADSGGRAALSYEDRVTLDRVAASATVDWAAVRDLKQRALDRSFAHFFQTAWRTGSARRDLLERYVDEHRSWIENYALFSVIHDRQRTAWWDWPTELKTRAPDALAQVRAEREEAIVHRYWLQWLLDEQWQRARAEARTLGVALKGDLPFMVSGDSADVWSHPADFRLDRRVGTPPDAFSATGQDWGLPAYDWDALGRNDFDWVKARAARSGALYDLYRVDHVIGLYRTWTRRASDLRDEHFSPAEEKDQIALGERVLGIFKQYGEVVGEDLGMVPGFLPPSLKRLGIPGYRVLRWEKLDDGTYREPEVYPVLSVATNGNHDIETNAQWWDELPSKERKALLAVPGLEHLDAERPFDRHARDALLRVLYLTPSELTVNPFQDLLGTRERVNVPGTVSTTNWTYRMPMDLVTLEADAELRARLSRLAAESRRVTGG